MRRRVLAGGLSMLSLSGCSALGLLNTLNGLTPGDAGTRRLAEGVAYGADPRQRLDVYGPGAPRGTCPVLVFFYGGGWNKGRRQDYVFVAQAFAARGYVVVIPDYRLVPQVYFPEFLEDGAAAMRWVELNIAAQGGDARRVAVAGHSAGAYIALMLALDAQWLRDAHVAADFIRGAVGFSGPYDFLPFDGAITRTTFGNAPDPVATQPIHFARADAPPTLLIHGSKDSTVYPRNSINLDKALTDAGAKSEIEIYPGLSHEDVLLALSRTFRGKAAILERTLTFLQSRLR